MHRFFVGRKHFTELMADMTILAMSSLVLIAALCVYRLSVNQEVVIHRP